MSLTCTGCGKKIETLPLECGYSLNVNSETNEMECFMENCGMISLSEFLCANCCTNRNVMKVSKAIEQLSMTNPEYGEELKQFKKNIIQTSFNDSDFNYWIEFGEGQFKCGKGIKNGASIQIKCPQGIMNKILLGETDAISQFLSGKLKIEGDIQYAVVYFDLLMLALEINRENRGELF